MLQERHLLPALDRVETVKLAGTPFEVAGEAVSREPGGVLVVTGGQLLRYRPEPIVVIGSGATAPLVITGR